MSKETEEDYSSETQSEHPAQDVTNQEVEENEEEEEEEEETCGFCIFMKGGGCKEQFEAWSTCVDTEREADKDFTETCREATIALRECMLAHKDYYQPLLDEEEKEMSQQDQLEAETAQSSPEDE